MNTFGAVIMYFAADVVEAMAILMFNGCGVWGLVVVVSCG